MPYLYTVPQCPKLLIEVRNLDSDRARYNAINKLVSLINEGSIDVQIPEGFTTQQLIEIREEDLMSDHEAELSQAVRTLSKLSVAKQKLQELQEQAAEVRDKIDLLFREEKIPLEEFSKITDGLKLLKEFAKANLRYKEALPDADSARLVVDRALKSSELE